MSRTGWSRLVLGAVAVAGIVVAGSAELDSVERANRLFRDGRVEDAVALYTARTRTDPADAVLRYNLGTALASLDSARALVELERAAASAPPVVAARAEYNRGLLHLERAAETTQPDSTRAAAAAAVAANRMAVRLEPANADARWNLALSLRLLDSIQSYQRSSGREQTDGAVEADVVTRSVNVPDPAEDERAEDPPAEGERETAAVVGDESPLAPDQAEELLGRSHRDATEILEKLLDLAGRGRWTGRTDAIPRR